MNINKLKLIAVMQIGLLVSNFSKEKINSDKIELSISEVKKE